MINMKRFFCLIGWHWMKNHRRSFTDCVSGKTVYRAECECGRKWQVDSKHSLGGFRVEREEKKPGPSIIDEIPVHDACGLPAELCTCPDAPVVWDNERGVFVDRVIPDENEES